MKYKHKTMLICYNAHMYTGYEIANNYKTIAISKSANKWYKTLTLSVFAGCFIALAGMLATIAGTGLETTHSLLVKAAVFPIGLILVVLTGSELFTGNCLLLSSALNKEIKITAMLKNLGIVYAGNLIGSIIISLIATYSGLLSNNIADATVSIATYKCTLSFGEALLRAIPCNILVCLAVWCSMASKSTSGKILAVYPPIFMFVACGFEHCVANMYYLTSGLLVSARYGIAQDGLNIGNSLLYGMLPSTLGNLIGGMICVALPLWLVFFRKKAQTDNGDKTTK